MFDWVTDFAAWLVQLLLYIPKKIFEFLLEALADILTAIPTPAFITDLQNAYNAMSPTVLYYLSLVQFQTGMLYIITALVARFLLRRIPFIGG